MKKKILIYDDNSINRSILNNILCDEYDVVEVSNNDDAIAFLSSKNNFISAMLLDINLPEMNGFNLLKYIRVTLKLNALPILVVTQNDNSDIEITALQYGATDFVLKPYNPVIIKQRLKNILSLSEAAAGLNYSEYDQLTGLLSKKSFYIKSKEIIHNNPDVEYCIISIDIDRFKIINDLFGVSEGDKLLKILGEKIENKINPKNSICARISADNFFVCMPYYVGIENCMVSTFNPNDADYPLSIKINLRYGVYLIDDIDTPINVMCDRANLASDSIKGLYATSYAFYSDAHREKIIQEQEIINDMHNALKCGQFKVYIQPKYNLVDNTLVGGEALVRWIHPEKGYITPDKFIPIFEKNSFISKLDRYIWEEVCKKLRYWIDNDYKVVPISVNVSRVDIYSSDFCNFLICLTKKYNLSPSLLELEITETAYMESAKQLANVVQTLKSNGFSVQMDDFGTGYSSLNMLNEIQVDVIKLDMKFLKDYNNELKKSGNILNFIVGLAKWLKIPVVAEGVETQEQVAYLRSMGCNIGQGYFFSKPIEINDYEKLMIENSDNIHSMSKSFFSTNININDFWNPTSQFNLLFNNFVGALLICELKSKDELSVLRVNDKFYNSLSLMPDAFYKISSNVIDYLYKDDKKRFVSDIINATETYNDNIADYRWVKKSDGAIIWLHCSYKCISKIDGSAMILASIENITEKKAIEEKLIISEQRLRTAVEQSSIIMWELDIKTRTIKIAPEIYVKHKLPEFISNVPESLIELGYIHPDCVQITNELYNKIYSGEHKASAIIKTTSKQSSYIWSEVQYSTLFDSENNPIIAIGIMRDVSSEIEVRQQYEREAQFRRTLTQNSVASCEFDLVTEELLHFSDNLANMFHITSSTSICNIYDAFAENFVHPDDRDIFSEVKDIPEILALFNMGQKELYFEFRIKSVSNEYSDYHWVGTTLYMIKNPSNGHPNTFIYMRDINEKKLEELKIKDKAERDSLTLLYNRAAFEQLTKHCILNNKKENSCSAFIIIDLDKFKGINDKYGHLYGDDVLVNFAEILKSHYYTTDIVARLGGDEFGVFMNNIVSPEIARKKANEFCDKVNSY